MSLPYGIVGDGGISSSHSLFSHVADIKMADDQRNSANLAIFDTVNSRKPTLGDS